MVKLKKRKHKRYELERGESSPVTYEVTTASEPPTSVIEQEGTLSAEEISEDKTDDKRNEVVSKIDWLTYESESIGTLAQRFIDQRVSADATTSGAEQVIRDMTPDEIKRALNELERKYNMSSKDFYTSWKKGEAPDIEGIDKIRWITLWEAWGNILDNP